MKNLKLSKMLLLVTGVILALVVAGCSSNDGEKAKGDLTDNYVKPKEVTERIENGETFAFAIVDKQCSACQAYKAGALKEFQIEDPGKITMIEVNGIENNEEDLVAITDLIQKHLSGQFEATPTTYFIKNGVLEDVVVGAVEYKELKENYDKNIVEGASGASKDEADVNEDNSEVDETEADAVEQEKEEGSEDSK